jgi:uncharacterized iron-regulated protein
MNTSLKYLAGILLLAGLLWLIMENDSSALRAYRVSDGQIISFGQMVDEIREAEVVSVGELHNNEFHHQLQLDIIKALGESGVPTAVGFEMFTAKSQEKLNEWVDGDLPAGDFIEVYYDNWKLPWPLYKDIFFYLREKKIPALGLNVPPEIAKKVASSGFASMSDEELMQLPPGISCNVDDEYMRFIQRAYRSHRTVDGRFIFFCEAQLLWDKAMAWHIVNYLGENPKRTVVVLAGAGHAWKRGIPEQLKGMSEEIKIKVVLPEVPDYIEPKDITTDDADYILLAP